MGVAHLFTVAWSPTMKRLFTLAVILIIIGGLSILAYPAASNYINQKHASYAISQSLQTTSQISDYELYQQKAMAQAYNLSLRNIDNAEGCTYLYEEILDFGNGIMGSLSIPKICVELPIYHGVEDAVLAKGVGHLPESAFPTGGKGNHSVLTGHTGLASAKLFSQLTSLEIGDYFYIQILNEKLTYKVDQILVVLPSEVEALVPEPNMDYCTLVTCTPYGINSHRLFVRGYRIDA